MQHFLFDLILYIPVNSFPLMLDVSSFEQKIKSCSRAQRSGSSEALTQFPSILSQELYHWSTALLNAIVL